MGWQPGGGSETGDNPDPAAPGGPGATRDDRLAGFASGGPWDNCPPGPELAAVVAAVAGPDWRCPGADPNELTGVLRRLAALESWVAAARLGVIREMIRQDDTPSNSRPRHGDLPDEWDPSLDHELALALACSVGSAQRTAFLAWELGARLPGTGRLLAEGTLTLAKARLVSETFALLSDEDAAAAEALLIAQLTGTTGKTFGQVANLAARAAATVDPGLAERRRAAAVRHGARVQFFREPSGAAALCGRDLPPDAALAADANTAARAALYRDSGAFGDARMDQLRAIAYLDLLNEVPPWQRIALGRLATDPDDDSQDDAETGDADDRDGKDSDDPSATVGGLGPEDSPDDPAPGGVPSQPPRLRDLVLPLATLLGLDDRPGEAHDFGILDPDLCRSLALLATASPHSQSCITVTGPDGITIGHGCARPEPQAGAPPAATSTRLTRTSGGPAPPLAALPARLNLTITTDHLSRLLASSDRSRETTEWALAPPDAHHQPDTPGTPVPPAEHHLPGKQRLPGAPRRPGKQRLPGDPDWCGNWTLTLPGGTLLTVRLEPVPTHDCDHRHESAGYQPNDTLRHLTQVRDYQCTFPSCSRHARESDFEHARPFDQGGRTCACNAGARSRACHRIKQSPGWQVTQPQPGWHQWTTPSGRTYTQAPYQYPV
jgi:hypothetical protein